MEAWNSADHAEKQHEQFIKNNKVQPSMERFVMKQHEQFIKNNKVQPSMERFVMNGSIDDMT